MVKVHTRAKRKLGLTTRFAHKKSVTSRNKKHGPKTFKTEEGAKEHANKLGLKAGKFNIVSAKKNKRFKVAILA